MNHAGGESIADQLSRKFRSMSTERDRYLNGPSYRAGDQRYDRSYASSNGAGYRAASPLTFSRSSAMRSTHYNVGCSYGDASRSTAAFYSGAMTSSSSHYDGSNSRSQTLRRTTNNGSREKGGGLWWNRRSGNRNSTSQSSLSNVSSPSGSAGSSSSSSSEATEPYTNPTYASSRRRKEREATKNRSRAASVSGAWRRRSSANQAGIPASNGVVYSPPSSAHILPSSLRWVGQEERRQAAQSNVSAPLNDNHPFSLTASPRAPPAIQPSELLLAVVESIAFHRGVRAPSSISPEVIIAFDEYIARGTTLLKFISRGPPHSRFFVVRFLEMAVGKSRSRSGTRAQAVLAWYRSPGSRHMIRYFPLHDLREVLADGATHPYVLRRTAQPGVLRGPRSGFFTDYIQDECILQLCFKSSISTAEERVALKAMSRTVYLAWLVVGIFLSRIGCA